MKIDPRYLQDTGNQVFTGNELLVKGALETPGGVHLLTGYPGSPIAGFFDAAEAIGPYLKEHGIVAKIASNEALAAAMANGAQMVEARSVIAMKSVGVHVAADALALGVLGGTRGDGGTLVVCGDDPWSDSTQVPADSRYLAEHLRMPMLEPSNAQEVKDWVALAFELGKAGQIYIGYSMTVTLADGGGTVELKPNHLPQINAEQRRVLSYEKDIKPTVEQSVLLPPRSWRRELDMPRRHAAVIHEARRLGINRIINKPQKGEKLPMAFIASGPAFSYLQQSLAEMNLLDRMPILKLGLSYPVDEKLVCELAEQCDQLFVIEERRGFVEKQVSQIVTQYRQRTGNQTQIWGKQFPREMPGIPDTRGLHPSLLIQRLVPLMRQHPTLPVELTNGRLSEEIRRIDDTAAAEVHIPNRTPTFCPGCPHRDSSSVLLELRKDLLDPQYMQHHYKRKPVDLVAHGDTGCYTMLMFEPTAPLMHNYSGMGLGGGTGLGVDPFIDNKQIVFMGDGTFYHSGQSAIAQSMYNAQDITYFILDNKTTAMTGHQPHAGVEQDLMGNPAFALDIERIVKGMVPEDCKSDVRVVRINPADRERYRELVEKTVLADGVKIIVADKECGITYHRRRRKAEVAERREQGFVKKQQFMNVATEVCEFCLECTSKTGCPGLTIVSTDYGPKIQTDQSWCVNDTACAKIHACPSFEQVTVHRKQPPRQPDEQVNLADIPEPSRPIHADQEIWRCYLAGVGGMGIGLATAILVTAGTEMGYHVKFLDKKGLAIRNGGVFSQILFTSQKYAATQTSTIPFGKADLLLGVDLLEATRSIDPKHQYRVASPDCTATVVNTAKTPTILTLLGEENFQAADLEKTLQRYSHPDRYFGFNVGDLCERMLENKLYANIMMIGVAFQLGYLPVKSEALEAAIRKVIRSDLDRNMRAFNIGRKLVARPDLFTVEARHEFETARQAFRRKVNTLRAQFPGKRGKRLSKQYRILLKQTLRTVRPLHVDDSLMRDTIIRAYDCVIWGGIDYARQYCNQLIDIFTRDEAKQDYALTRAAVWNLAKVMLIKDEPYVAAMLTSPEKYRQDRKRLNVNPARGDRIVYEHYNRPEFEIFGRKIRFKMRTRDWQLRIMARCGWLRGLLPGWHRREREFRDWYIELLEQARWSNQAEYDRWVQILKTPEAVTGYREVRYPKMEHARTQVQSLLSESIDEPGDKSHRARIRISLSDKILSNA